MCCEELQRNTKTLSWNLYNLFMAANLRDNPTSRVSDSAQEVSILLPEFIESLEKRHSQLKAGAPAPHSCHPVTAAWYICLMRNSRWLSRVTYYSRTQRIPTCQKYQKSARAAVVHWFCALKRRQFVFLNSNHWFVKLESSNQYSVWGLYTV